MEVHTESECSASALAGSHPEKFIQHQHSHRTHTANVRIYGLLHSLSIRLQLSEEKINLIIIPVIVIGDNCGAHKFRFC